MYKNCDKGTNTYVGLMAGKNQADEILVCMCI